MFVQKRFFGKYSEHAIRGQVKTIGHSGLLFKHTNFVLKNSDEEYCISLDKYHTGDIRFLMEKMDNQETVKIIAERHYFGNPVKGFLINPMYLKTFLG